MTYLKRLNIPKSWKIRKKEHTWVTRPNPGPHKLEWSVSLSVALRDILGFVDNLMEAKKVLNKKYVLVNGKVRTDHKSQIGLMDVLEISELKKQYKVKLDKRGRIFFEESEKVDSRLCRVENKKKIKGKKTQLNLWGGLNMLVDKDEYKTGDVLKIALKDNKVMGKIEFKQGSTALIIGGKHVGKLAKIKEIKQNVIMFDAQPGFSTKKEYAYVVK